MSVLETLISVDRIVIAGLTAFDRATAHALDQLGENLRRAGHTASEIDETLEPYREHHRASRARLHRELWTKALATIAEADACPLPTRIQPTPHATAKNQEKTNDYRNE